MNAPAFHVRDAEVADVATLQDLNAQLFAFEDTINDHSRNLKWPYTPYAHNYFDQACRRRNGFVAWIAEIDGQAVGYLCASLTTRLYLNTNPVAEIENMFVQEGHRRTGVGSALVAKFKAWATSQKAGRLRVGAYSANHPALAFYRRHGFGDIIIELEQPFGEHHEAR